MSRITLRWIKPVGVECLIVWVLLGAASAWAQTYVDTSAVGARPRSGPGMVIYQEPIAAHFAGPREEMVGDRSMRGVPLATNGAVEVPAISACECCQATAKGHVLPSGWGWLGRAGKNALVLAPGDLVPHYSYQTAGTYYYDRPYNQLHVRTSSPPVVEATQTATGLPYSNRAFDELAVRLDEKWRAEAVVALGAEDVQPVTQSLLERDKYLEYVDWQAYRIARERWEREQQAEEELPEHLD